MVSSFAKPHTFEEQLKSLRDDMPKLISSGTLNSSQPAQIPIAYNYLFKEPSHPYKLRSQPQHDHQQQGHKHQKVAIKEEPGTTSTSHTKKDSKTDWGAKLPPRSNDAPLVQLKPSATDEMKPAPNVGKLFKLCSLLLSTKNKITRKECPYHVKMGSKWPCWHYILAPSGVADGVAPQCTSYEKKPCNKIHPSPEDLTKDICTQLYNYVTKDEKFSKHFEPSDKLKSVMGES